VDEEVWLYLREEAIAFARETEQKALNQWLEEIGAPNEKIAYKRSHDSITIYSTRPGVLIGSHGQNIDPLKSILKENFHIDHTVKFEEITGFIGGNKQ